MVSGVAVVAMIDDDSVRSWVLDVVDAVLSYVPISSAVPFFHRTVRQGMPILCCVGYSADRSRGMRHRRGTRRPSMCYQGVSVGREGQEMVELYQFPR